MRWFKHLTKSRNDEKLVKLQDEFGAAGYGAYWIILEVIAENMDSDMDKNCPPCVELSLKRWSKFVGFSPKKCQKVVEFLSNLELITLKVSGQNYRIGCPNLLKYKDEYTRKSGHKEQKYPDSVRHQSQRQIQNTETETDNTPHSPPKGNTESSKKSKNKKIDVDKKYSDKFLEFWSAYPKARREGKGNAWKAWQARVKEGEEDIVIAAIKRQCATIYKNRDPKYVPLPATWLNQKRWEDEAESGSDDRQEREASEQPHETEEEKRELDIWKRLREGGWDALTESEREEYDPSRWKK